MTSPDADTPPDDPSTSGADDDGTICVLAFNANDPSGAGGLTADITAAASVGAHALAIATGAYVRDSAEVFDHFPLDDEAVTEQARVILEDITVQAIKVGFVGTPENIAAVAAVAADYADVPVIAYMPNLSWWEESEIDGYLDAFRELMLPQAAVLVGNHSTLWRWLLPDWSSERAPSAKDIAKAAAEAGTPYTLVTGLPLPEQHIDNVLASPQQVLASAKFERFEATFAGAGDTLSAALASLVAAGVDLGQAAGEALAYLDRSLDAGFRPGMGHILPDRMFWAQDDDDDDGAPAGAAGSGETDEAPTPDELQLLNFPRNDLKH